MDPIQSQPATKGQQPNISGGSLKPTAILEPISESVSIRVPWYKRLFVSGVRTETVWRLSFVMLFIVGILVGLAFQQRQVTTTHAGTNHARVSLLPISTHLPPDTFVQLWVTTDAPLTAGQFEVAFDPAKVTVVDVTTPADFKFANAITVTPAGTVNKNGKLTIIFAVTPTKTMSGPNGTFQLTNITLRAKSKTSNDSTEIRLVPQDTKLFHDAVPFSISALSNTILLINSKE